jgi:ATP-binding protein involved in chromosome partitioning
MANEALLMRVRRALQAVRLADGRDVVSAGAVDALSANAEGVVAISLDAAPLGPDGERIAAAVKSAAGVEGATRVSVALTAHRANSKGAQGSQPRAGGHANPLGLNPVELPKSERLAEAANALAAVKKVLVVASGKGGVGKSTVAVNLAYAFSRAGLKVGILDADITGPSVPTLFGGAAPQSARDGKIAPVERRGVKAMSIGYLVDPGKAVAWRGPMVMGAVRQLMGDVDWGALDILIVDTPPGSSDAHLTLAQSGVVSGVVIVSTPQLIALADVRRGAALFRQVGAPIVGVIENMAWIETPAGPQRLFGEGGAEKLASEIAAPFLGRLPLWPDLATISDSGEPIDAAHPAARAFDALARKIAAGLKVEP